ncbi:MAG: hypothetical protein QOJ22_1283, partial [Thermoleophilaceae bacterium]|nr:hypothetical protein [Thermoleophilaceae bacterium]
ASVPVSPPADTGTPGELDPRAARAVEGHGRPLEATTRRTMETRFRTDLAGVRVHDDTRAAAATREAGAEALALGDDVALGTRLDPSSPRARGLLAHELAHVVQQRAAGSVAVQRNGGTPAAPATTLDALPEADRKRIQLVTTRVTVPDLAGKFATTGTKTTIPPAATTAFDASVDAALQAGLSNVAGSLSTTIELTPAPLPPNSTITLELDVGGKIGKGLFRFTYHEPAAAAGSKTAAPVPRILVESLGKAAAPPGTKAPPAAKEGETPAPDPVAEKIKKHSLSQSYSGDELDALRAALDQIPDAQLSIVDGLKFDRAGAKKGDPTASGDYDPKTHTVTMYDKAFTSAQNRYKGPGTVASTGGTRAIVHEIGHAIDLSALRKANAERVKADAAVDALSTKYPDPDKKGSYKYVKGGPEEADVKAVIKAQEDAEKGALSARSLSGSRTIKKPDGTFEDEIAKEAKGNKFRDAAKKDGGKAATAYGDTDWQEAFAEAYSLYITAPDTLKALRPNVFAYLDTSLPK